MMMMMMMFWHMYSWHIWKTFALSNSEMFFSHGIFVGPATSPVWENPGAMLSSRRLIFLQAWGALLRDDEYVEIVGKRGDETWKYVAYVIRKGHFFQKKKSNFSFFRVWLDWEAHGWYRRELTTCVEIQDHVGFHHPKHRWKTCDLLHHLDSFVEVPAM